MAPNDIPDHVLDGWAEKSKTFRYNAVREDSGVCSPQGGQSCSDAFVRVFGQWYPGTSSTPSDSSTPEGAIDRALARIHEAWEEAAEQVRTALPAGHDLSSHELGIHLTPDGPRMVLILFDQTHETAVVH